jgi:glycosyltransferase involved in cell wall biosynthesis
MQASVFCSYIIPTIGRSTLERSVMSVLEQELHQGDFEVIVVNDSGEPLLKAKWQDSPRVRIINTNRRERSFARNSGAAIAKGAYVAFLDDDDWLLPGALNSLWELACREKEAAWLYGGIRIVDEGGETLAELNSALNGNRFAQIMGGAWAPIQASMIATRAFFLVGGFNPFICGTEDEDLCRKIAYHGDIANTSAVVACLFRGKSWDSSTNYLRASEDTKYSRDLILAEPDTYSRLLTSAESSYWYGRICRVYLSTVTWNWRNKRLFSGFSRLLFTFAIVFRSAKHMLAREFWNGLKAEHVPGTLHFVMQAYERDRQDKPKG